MLDNSTIPVAVEQDLKPSGFFDNRNRVIYETIINLFIKDNPIDHITLTNRLEKLGTLGVAGGYSYILEIPTFLPTPANIENYIEIVKNKAIQRQYIDIGTQIATVARSEENAEKIKNFAITKLLQINKQHEKGIETCTVEEIKPEDIRICEIFAHGVKIKSGAIWGIVGTTSTGKTELALDIVTAYQKQDTQNIALFCEYEGTKKEFLSRVSRKKIQGKIYYGIKPNYTDIIGFVMQHKDKNILIIIDYLQMFAGRLQVQNRHSSDFLKRYVNEIYQFFDNLRIKYENISVCLISSMSKADIGEISKTNVIKNRDIFLNSIKESGDVQYSLDYAYGMVFSEGKNKYTLSRFDEEGKAKKYMRLITIKGSRLGEKTKDQVYTFDTETHSYCLKHSFELTTTTITEQNNEGFKI